MHASMCARLLRFEIRWPRSVSRATALGRRDHSRVVRRELDHRQTPLLEVLGRLAEGVRVEGHLAQPVAAHARHELAHVGNRHRPVR